MTRRIAMSTVDLVYDVDCPNVAAARVNLLQAFALLGRSPKWSEHRIGDPGAPERVRGYGSPTVLVDGRDVEGVEPAAEVCCRVYNPAPGDPQTPSVKQIAGALSKSTR
jgi:hypothetical protein